MTPQDITYMRGLVQSTICFTYGIQISLTYYLYFFSRSMKQNLVVLLADFFNLFEIHPTKCVCYPGMEQPSGNDFQSILVSNFF